MLHVHDLEVPLPSSIDNSFCCEYCILGNCIISQLNVNYFCCTINCLFVLSFLCLSAYLFILICFFPLQCHYLSICSFIFAMFMEAPLYRQAILLVRPHHFENTATP